MAALNGHDNDKPRLARELSLRFDLSAPTSGPHAGKSALEACCRCGGGTDTASVGNVAKEQSGSGPAGTAAGTQGTGNAASPALFDITYTRWKAMVGSIFMSYTLCIVGSGICNAQLSFPCARAGRGLDTHTLYIWLRNVANDATCAYRDIPFNDGGNNNQPHLLEPASLRGPPAGCAPPDVSAKFY